MADKDPRALTAQIMKETRIATLTYVDDEGRLVSTPMGTQDFEDPGTVWFITEPGHRQGGRDPAAPRGQRRLRQRHGLGLLRRHGRDQHRPRQGSKRLWDPSVSAYMKGDAQDPNNGLIEVRADTAEYWESPGKAAMLVHLVKGLVTDDKAEDEDDDSSGVVQALTTRAGPGRPGPATPRRQLPRRERRTRGR